MLKSANFSLLVFLFFIVGCQTPNDLSVNFTVHQPESFKFFALPEQIEITNISDNYLIFDLISVNFSNNDEYVGEFFCLREEESMIIFYSTDHQKPRGCFVKNRFRLNPAEKIVIALNVPTSNFYHCLGHKTITVHLIYKNKIFRGPFLYELLKI